MPQDFKSLLREYQQANQADLPDGHLQRFEAALDKSIPSYSKNQPSRWTAMALGFAVCLISGSFVLLKANTFRTGVSNTPAIKKKIKTSNLAKISPEYQEIESFFLTRLQTELSKIKVNENNQELISSFRIKLSQLDEEYQALNLELVTQGLRTTLIQAMTENLQFRLSLLKTLQQKLKVLEHIDDENYAEI